MSGPGRPAAVRTAAGSGRTLARGRHGGRGACGAGTFGLASFALGALVALLGFAPARWLTQAVTGWSGHHLLLAQAQGSVWAGSAEVVLQAGPTAREASRLPGRLHWRWTWQNGGPAVHLRLDCCTPHALVLLVQSVPASPATSGWQVALRSATSTTSLGTGPGAAPPALPTLHLPAAWLTGLGTPWNTLQPTGHLHLRAPQFALQFRPGSATDWQAVGRVELEIEQLGTRLSPMAPLGHYRLRWNADPGGSAHLHLDTLDTGVRPAALRLSGQGEWVQGRLRFRGQARAAPGHEAALNNVLNILGRREGELTWITLG